MADIQEQWRPVPGWENLYAVSSHGRLRSLRSGRISRAKPHKTLGYVLVRLRNAPESEDHYMHRLVLLAFAGPCPAGCEASHLNGDRADNRLENLCWESHKDNNERQVAHGTRPRGIDRWNAKLTDEDVADIQSRWRLGQATDVIAAIYDITPGYVWELSSGRKRG